MNTNTDSAVIRCYVVELEEGDVTTDGDIVASVERITDHKTIVTMENGKRFSFGRGNSTMLIMA